MLIERINVLNEHLLVLTNIYNSLKKLTVVAVTTNIDSNRINSHTDDVENTFTIGWKENGELG
ncbi:hypothetical protein CSV73_06160 [Sporosarcina sp. P1]|nr:hypothetical protein CSV73_06160 [Sporosarcina sp. P1]